MVALVTLDTAEVMVAKPEAKANIMAVTLAAS